jgi:hypothetical protein
MAQRGLLLLIGCCFASNALGFVVLPRYQRHQRTSVSNTVVLFAQENQDEKKTNKVLDFLMDPYESKIPKELEAEIYRAEGNTPAAKERTQRVIMYGIIAISLVACAFFNGFLTELRHSDIMDPSEGNMSLQDLGFGWVQANFLFRFLFLNKIGGGLALVSGAGTGMLAEAELDSRRKNAERIWEELERRRNEGAPTKKKKRRATVTQSRKKKKQSGKQAKRLGALSEVVLEEPKPETVSDQQQTEPVAAAREEKKEGVMDKVKGWYEKADSMAASQALLLNKKLEEEGIVDKITDESGLKVIGKEAAAKLQSEGGANADEATLSSKETDQDAKTTS